MNDLKEMKIKLANLVFAAGPLRPAIKNLIYAYRSNNAF